MALPDETRRELTALFWSLQDGSFSPADVERLERLAEQHAEVRIVCTIHGDVRRSAMGAGRAAHRL